MRGPVRLIGWWERSRRVRHIFVITRGVVVNSGTNHGVSNCLIYGTGDGGISLSGGDRKKLLPSGHYARNNHIHHIAK
ncbi:MAG: hypothetical protein ACETWQ_07685 [Phycisphaerae bacterium]